MLHSIISDGEPISQVCAAVQAMRGGSVVITEIKRDTAPLGPLFPKGTIVFHVFRESNECTHEPPCTWQDLVFYCENHCVVLSPREAQAASLRALRVALKGQEQHG